MDISTKILSDITVYMKYARYIPEKKRRETWKELVERNKKMHIKKYPELKSQIDKAYKFVLDKKVKKKLLKWYLLIPNQQGFDLYHKNLEEI